MPAGQSQHHLIAIMELLLQPEVWKQLSGHQSGGDAMLKILTLCWQGACWQAATPLGVQGHQCTHQIRTSD